MEYWSIGRCWKRSIPIGIDFLVRPSEKPSLHHSITPPLHHSDAGASTRPLLLLKANFRKTNIRYGYNTFDHPDFAANRSLAHLAI
jgi:hypothetical protein